MKLADNSAVCVIVFVISFIRLQKYENVMIFRPIASVTKRL